MKLTGAAIAAVALVAAVLTFVNSQRSTSTSAPTTHVREPATADAARLAQLGEDLAELRRDLTAIKSQLSAQQSPLATQRADSVSSTSPPQSQRVVDDVTEQRAAYVERRREYINGLAQSFAGETVDSVWANRAATRVNAALEDDEALRDVSHSVECRQQTCRIEVGDADKLNERMPSIALSLADVLPNISADRVERGAGHDAMVLYLSNRHPARPTSPRP